jgi:hypothetical protein
MFACRQEWYQQRVGSQLWMHALSEDTRGLAGEWINRRTMVCGRDTVGGKEALTALKQQHVLRLQPNQQSSLFAHGPAARNCSAPFETAHATPAAPQ